MTTSEVIRGILLSADELLRVEQLTVCSSADLIDHSRLQVQKDCTGDVLPGARLAEERIESIVSNSRRLLARNLAIRLQKRTYHSVNHNIAPRSVKMRC